MKQVDKKNLLCWIAGTWGESNKLTMIAKTLSESRLASAVIEFFDESGLDTIEMLSPENQQLLYDIMEEHHSGQCADFMERYY